MYNVFLMLDDDFVKVFASESIITAQSVCDKLNEKMGEPLYYVK